MGHEMNMTSTEHRVENDYQCTRGGAAGSANVCPPQCSLERNLGQTS